MTNIAVFPLTQDAFDLDELVALEDAFGIPLSAMDRTPVLEGDPETDASARLDARLAYVSLLHDMLTQIRGTPGLPRTLSPQTPLVDLMGRTPPDEWLAALSDRCDLNLRLDLVLPGWVTAALWTAAAAIVLGAITATAMTGEWGGLLLICAAPLLTMMPNLPRRLPRDVRTLGDLLRTSLPQNQSRLRADFVPKSPEARRDTLLSLTLDRIVTP